MGNIKAGSIGNIRRSKYVSVLYWTLFYTYTFLIATNWFIYEAPFVAESFSSARIINLISSSVAPFAISILVFILLLI